MNIIVTHIQEWQQNTQEFYQTNGVHETKSFCSYAHIKIIKQIWETNSEEIETCLNKWLLVYSIDSIGFKSTLVTSIVLIGGFYFYPNCRVNIRSFLNFLEQLEYCSLSLQMKSQNAKTGSSTALHPL